MSKTEATARPQPKPAPTFPMSCPVTDKLNTADAVASLYR
jgi:hypothetical protein